MPLPHEENVKNLIQRGSEYRTSTIFHGKFSLGIGHLITDNLNTRQMIRPTKEVVTI